MDLKPVNEGSTTLPGAKLVACSAPEGRDLKEGVETIPRSPPNYAYVPKLLGAIVRYPVSLN